MQSTILLVQMRPSVRHTVVLYRHECIRRQNFHRSRGRFFSGATAIIEFQGNFLSSDVIHTGSWEICDLQAEIAVYLGNSAR